jgi:hypothetical protein
MASDFSLGSATKVAAALAALAYGTGVVAINTYLHGLGITDFSFAKPKLLLTGTVVLVSFVLLSSAPLFLAWSYCVRLEGKQTEGTRSLEMLIVGLVALALLIFAAFLLCFRLDSQMGKLQAWWLWEHLSHDGNVERSFAVLAIVLGVFSPGCAAAFFAFKAKQYWMRAKPVDGGSCIPLEYFHFAGSAAMVLICFIAYITIFAFVFYPSLPVEYGGGKPYFESFAIAEGQVCALERLGVPFGSRRGITNPLPVLHETDTLVAIWLQGKASTPEAAESSHAKGGSAPETSVAPSEDATSKEADLNSEKNLTGWGDTKLVVVQLEQSSVVASRAYPHYSKMPLLRSSEAGCQAPAIDRAGP